MTFLLNLLLFLHLMGMAILVGTWIFTMKRPTVTSAQLWSAVLMLVTGLAMMGIHEAQPGAMVNHAKLGVKFVILIIILVAAIIGRRKVKRGQPVSTGLAHSVGGLALINAAIAVFWS